ncbi:MAG: hypothetical protein U1E65_02330 [Myxococcota bacterium]
MSLEEEITETLLKLERQIQTATTLGQREAARVRLNQTQTLVGKDPKGRAAVDTLRQRLETLDETEFEAKRAALATGKYGVADFAADLRALPPHAWDHFSVRLFDVYRVPTRETPKDKLMVDYVQTGVQTIFEIVPELGPSDVLYDIGSGLGLVVLLLEFLTPARIKGVEIEPAYHRVLEERIRRFGRVRATSILGAAEAHDYSDATAIYMYYPMRGERMNRLMQKIEADTRGRPLRVYSTGHASDALAELPWLEARGISPSKMAGFQRK